MKLVSSRLALFFASFFLSIAALSCAQTTETLPTTPTTNVGAASDTNVQNRDLKLIGIPIADFPASLNRTAGTLTLPADKRDPSLTTLVSKACDADTSSDRRLDDRSTYVLFNVLRFSSGSRQTIVSNNWYVFSKQKTWYHTWSVSDFDGATRFYGAKKIILVTVLLNQTIAPAPQISYTLTVKKATPTNVASVYSLLGAVFSGPPMAFRPVSGLDPGSFWGCSAVPIAYRTSSIKVDTSYPTADPNPFTSSLTFTNEAKQYWDVSFALPVKKATALSYTTTSNTVTASQINKESLFAVADLYFPPVDLYAKSYSLIPHPFAGVAMNSQPLHSLLFGGSMGLHLAEVYVGALLIKQQNLNGLATGSSATPAQLASATSNSYKASFSIGIKISISSAVAALKK